MREAMAHTSNSKLLADLGAPAFVGVWQQRALVGGAVAAVFAVALGFLGQQQDGLGWDHFLRAWTLGTVVVWGFAVGGLALLMVSTAPVADGGWCCAVRSKP